MTDFMDFRTLLHLARDTLVNPREGAAQVLRIALPTQALVLLFALAVVGSMIVSEITTLVFSSATADPFEALSPIVSGVIQAGILYFVIHAIHRIGMFFGGKGTLHGAFILVIWLQFILIAVQLAQVVIIMIFPPLAPMITILVLGLFFWLLVNFIAVLHGFTMLWQVAVATLLSTFVLIFTLSFILVTLGIVPARFQ